MDDIITVSDVSDEKRLRFLPSHLGKYLLLGEALVYGWMQRLCKQYSGGSWNFSQLSNGGFFMFPRRNEPVLWLACENGYQGHLTPQAAGIVATLYALCQLANSTEDERLIDKFHLLRDYALVHHPEAVEIARAID